MGEPKWKVGDRAYVEGDLNRLGGGVFTVVKVGRKWITVAGYRGRQFDIVTGKENNPSGVGGGCYARTKDEHEMWLERTSVLSRINGTRQMRSYESWERWPLDRLRRLAAVLEENEVPRG